MKAVINAGIGGMNFIIEEDAYQRLDSYLNEFRSKSGVQSGELMEDVELRIADIFKELQARSHVEVVSKTMVEEVIVRIGMPDGSASTGASYGAAARKTTKKFYRNPDDKKIGGVCSGLAAYFDVDVILIRVVFLVALFCGSAGLWVYIIFWIIAPLAHTAAQKCEMRGIEANAENMRHFYSNK